MTDGAFAGVDTVTVNGTPLAYREEGEGEPVVFVHGGLSDLRTWQSQLPVIGRSYRAIAYSRRFARPNDDIDPAADDPMHPHVDDLIAFLHEIDASPAHLVGNSWGAFIGLLAALRRPDCVRTLFAEEPPVISLFWSTPPRLGEVLRLLVTRPRTALPLLRFGAGTIAPAEKAFRRGDDEAAMRTFLEGVMGEDPEQQLGAERMQQMRDNLSALRAQLLGAGFPPLRDEELRGLRTPVMLATGARSPVHFERLSDRLAELLPVVERVRIPDASHGMHEENAPATNQAILAFVGRHRGAHG